MLILNNALYTPISSVHEQMYSAIFDGTGDFLSVGDALDIGTNDFVISFWTKFADATDQRFLSKRVDDNNQILIRTLSSDKIFVRVEADSTNVISATCGTALTSVENLWVNICVTCDRSGNSAIYVNGATTLGKADFSSANSSQNLDNTGSWNIGRALASYFTGNIDDVAIWIHADLSDFDDNAAEEIYNLGKPFDLRYDRGDYHHSDKLVGYWRMFNGTNDDKVNGIVMDQTAPTIGPNLVAQPGFETHDGWTADLSGGGTSSAVDTTFSHSGNNSWKIVQDGSTEGLGINSPDITVEADTFYKFSVWAYRNGGSTWVEIGRADGNLWVNMAHDDNRRYGGDNIPDQTWTKITGVFKTASSGTAIKISINNGSIAGTNGDTKWFDDIELVKLGGNPGIANADATHSTDTPDD